MIMKIKHCMLALTAVCTILAAPMTGWAAPAAPDVTAEAAYMVNADTGEALYTKHADEEIYPGSTTKIMTCVLGLEMGKDKLDQPIKITDDSLNLTDASVLGLYPGDQVTLRNAMTGMMLVSGCDAAVDVAETVAPTQADFVKAMNTKAAALGMTHTHFANPHGLPDPDHYSSARDLAKIAVYAMNLPEFRSMVNRSTYDMPYINGSTKHCVSTNKFLTSGFAGANGIKTGTTNAGGACLVASATQDGNTLIAVVLKSDDRFGDAQKLLKYGFDQFPKENVYITRDVLLQQDADKQAAQATQAANNQTASASAVISSQHITPTTAATQKTA
jgi:D-alanyl-D-alanine carboxypeptidase (penicillin-binding protein 5/6)